MQAWRALTTWDEVCRRSSGRRAYNALRRDRAMLRRQKVVQLLRRYGRGHGVQARMARELGVSEATISRDIAALWALGHGCPCCGGWRGDLRVSQSR